MNSTVQRRAGALAAVVLGGTLVLGGCGDAESPERVVAAADVHEDDRKIAQRAAAGQADDRAQAEDRVTDTRRAPGRYAWTVR